MKPAPPVTRTRVPFLSIALVSRGGAPVAHAAWQLSLQLFGQRRRASSAGAPPEEDDLGGVKEDLQIQTDGKMLDVVQVVFELVAGLLEAGRIGKADLRPAGDPRRHEQAQVVVGDLVAQVS